MKSRKKIHKILLGLIIFLAFLLRFYKLGEIPPGVNRDEASIGYTAYSLLKTGKDEYSQTFPVSFKSFGDWKLPLYIYLTTPFVAVFGVSEISVRVVSAIAGVMTVILTYFLIKELLAKREVALLTSFLLAISPWHLHLSRVESESNLAVFLTSLAILLFLKSLKDRLGGLIILSSFLFSLTYFTYHGNHAFTTLLLFGLLVIFQKEIPRNKATFTAVLIFLFLTGFILSKTLFSADVTKLSGISIYSDPTVVHTQIELSRNEHNSPQLFFPRMMHNRAIFALEKFGQNYIKAFSPEFLFIKGGENKAHNIANFGNMYLVEVPFFLLGIFYLMVLHRNRKRFPRQTTLLVFWWFLVAPIASSITKDAPHTNRMFAIFPILPLITAFGVFGLLNTISQHKFFRKMVVLGVSVAVLLNISIYIDRYFIHFPLREGENWGIAYRQLSEFLERKTGAYEEIIISRPQESPYIFFLFYQNYDPLKFQEEVIRYPEDKEGFHRVKSFDGYTFRDINYPEDLRVPDRLLIDKTLDMTTWATSSSYLVGIDAKGQKHSIETRVKRQIETPGGKPIFTILETYSEVGR